MPERSRASCAGSATTPRKAGLFAFFALAEPWPLRVAVVVAALSAVEEIATTLCLPRWRADIPGLFHLWLAPAEAVGCARAAHEAGGMLGAARRGMRAGSTRAGG